MSAYTKNGGRSYDVDMDLLNANCEITNSIYSASPWTRIWKDIDEMV